MISLSTHLRDYLELRQRLGFKLRGASRLLHKFVRHAEENKTAIITTKFVLEWATQPPELCQSQKAIRLSVVRRFAQYVSAVDPRTEVPTQGLIPHQFRRNPPHLYRDEDVARLIEAARKIKSSENLKGVTLSTLFALLAVTGMRVGEALALNHEDVDLDHAVLTVRKSKGKTRLVPIHASTQRALHRYAQIRDRICPQQASSSFFIFEEGTRLLHWTVNKWFLVVARQIGLRRPTGREGLRLHDLRHRFAIRTLLKWYQGGTNVEVHLSELATYLGHVHVQDTYWYLSAVPELLNLATRRWQRMERGYYA